MSDGDYIKVNLEQVPDFNKDFNEKDFLQSFSFGLRVQIENGASGSLGRGNTKLVVYFVNFYYKIIITCRLLNSISYQLLGLAILNQTITPLL